MGNPLVTAGFSLPGRIVQRASLAVLENSLETARARGVLRYGRERLDGQLGKAAHPPPRVELPLLRVGGAAGADPAVVDAVPLFDLALRAEAADTPAAADGRVDLAKLALAAAAGDRREGKGIPRSRAS
jgi:hypothetical protein